MVYKNSIKAYAARSRRGYGRTMLRGYAQGAGAIALGVAGYKLAKKLKDKINTEFKSVVSNYALTDIGNVDANCEKLFLSGIDLGDTGSTRDGSQVRLKGVTLRGKINLNQSTSGTNPPTIIRMVVFQQKSCCGSTQPLLTDLINAGAGTAALGFYNLDNVPINFRILKDKTWLLDEVNREALHFNEHIKLNSVMRYDGNTDSYADQSTNAIFCMFFSDAGSNLPDGNMSVRIRYVDN